MTSTGYQPIFHMPVISPPQPGQDPSTYYDQVSADTAVQVTAADHLGLYIKISNAAYNSLFAMNGGIVSFIPTGGLLPTTSPEFVQGAGALILQTWIADFEMLKATATPGMPAMVYVLYLNVEHDSVALALKPHVQATKDPILQTAWTQTSPAPDHNALAANYLNHVLLGNRAVFVPGGTFIGAAAVSSTDLASDRVVILRLLDSAGNDLSPILHLRNMENYGGSQWHDHPLISGVSNIPVPVNIYVRFEVWNGVDNSYLPLPASVAVDLRDYDRAIDEPLLTELTDDQGTVHFSTTLELLDLIDPDDATIDLYFLAHPGGFSVGGNTLPNEWSTKGWKAVDGSPGYYENFNSSQLGAPTAPLVFRIGFDFHLELAYDDGLSRQGLSPAGIPIVVVVDDDEVLVWSNGNEQEWLETDSKGQVHGIIFDIEGGDSVLFHINYQMEDNNINLKRAFVNVHDAESFKDMFITYWPLTQLSSLHPVTWPKDINDPANFLPDNELTSIGKQTIPTSLLSKARERNAALYVLKIFREWSTFLYFITGQDWKGISDLNLNLIPKAITDTIFFLGKQKMRSVSYPVGNVNFVDDDYFDRQTIAHELSHQIMWKLLSVSSLDIAYKALIERTLEMNHWHGLLANKEQALIEGWAEFMAMVFGDTPFPMSTISLEHDDGSPAGSLGPPPNNRGEEVEGAFANGLWGIFEKHVAPSGTVPAYIPESSDGEATTSAPWITHATVIQNFLNLIWKPLNDLWAITHPGSTDMLQAIKLRNLPIWHVLQGELQNNNLMTNLPNIITIFPSTGPMAGLQNITITGTEFVNGMAVEIGGDPATNVAVVDTTTLTALTPPGSTAGPADVIIVMKDPKAGSSTLPNGYAYLEMPNITSVSPTTGPKAGGQSVSIVGAHFVAGMGVKIGGLWASDVLVGSSTQLTAQTPSATIDGPVDVIVETAGGSSTLVQGYTYAN